VRRSGEQLTSADGIYPWRGRLTFCSFLSMGAWNVVGIFGCENEVRAQHRGFKALALPAIGTSVWAVCCFPPATLRHTMAQSFDVERRRRKRIFNLLVVQSTPAFRLYMQECDSGAAPDLDPPDPWDSSISVRRWNWLMRQYDQAIKRFAANRVGCWQVSAHLGAKQAAASLAHACCLHAPGGPHCFSKLTRGTLRELQLLVVRVCLISSPCPGAARDAGRLAKRLPRLPRASTNHGWDVAVGPGNGIRCSHLGC
jgi:hypothetical protein